MAVLFFAPSMKVIHSVENIKAGVNIGVSIQEEFSEGAPE
jgi:hypothetical protein